MPLKRHIGPVGLLFIGISGIIGSGWLFAPFYAAQYAGPASLIAWVIGMVMILFIALCFTELGTLLPLSGGVVRYIQYSHGSPVSYLISWVNWLAFAVMPALEVRATLQYSGYYFPQLFTDPSLQTHPLSGWGFLFAAILMLFFVIVNVFGIRVVSYLNATIVWWKLAIPMIAIVTLLTQYVHVQNFTEPHGFFSMGVKGIFSAVVMGGVIFSFAGFRAVIELAGEVKKPHFTIPFAVIGALVVCLIVYLLLQFAFIGALRPKDFVDGWQHLHFTTTESPLISVVAFLGVIWLVTLLYIDAIVSPSGTGLVHSTSTARILYAMAQNGFLPRWFAYTNRAGSPILAIVINFIVGMLFFLPFPSWRQMMEVLVSMGVLAYSIGPLCLAAFRSQLPEYARPFKVPFYHGFCVISFFICNFIIVLSGWQTLWKLAIMLCIGVFVLSIYIVSRFHRRYSLFKKYVWHECRGSSWFIIYFLGMLLISYLSGLGGGDHLLSLGWMTLCVAIFSFIIYVMAFKLRLRSEVTSAYVQLNTTDKPHTELL